MTAEFAAATRSAVHDLLHLNPVLATALGDHDGDHRLPDLTDGAVHDALLRIDDHVTTLDALDDEELSREQCVDLEILRARLTAVRFDLAEIRRRQWDPLAWNPATAIHLLIARDFAPPEARLRSVVARLNDVPRFLADARSTLREMSGLHVETAMAQLRGFASLLATAAPLADAAPGLSASFASAAEAAQAEVDRHVAWLGERLPESRWDPRLGVRLYSAALWHNLDEELTPVQVLEEAERHLDSVVERMRDEAAILLGGSPREPDIVRRALARIAAEAPVDDRTVLPVVREALARTTRFVRENDLVSLPDVETRVIEMPEYHRGVAVAYCDAPGPLEAADVATFVAVAPTPADWDAGRVTSFYREYNAVLLHDLTVHEAMPGHVLQLAHARGSGAPRRHEARRGLHRLEAGKRAGQEPGVVGDFPRAQRLDPGALGVRDHRRLEPQEPRLLRRGGQQVPLAADGGDHRRDDLLADRVERRVGHLGEELLEVVGEHLGPVGKHGQRRVVAHRTDRLGAGRRHRADDHTQILERVAEGPLELEQAALFAGDTGGPPGVGGRGCRRTVATAMPVGPG